MKILFVCSGNTCRSPLAEFLFREMAGEKDKHQVRSAGVTAFNGDPASYGDDTYPAAVPAAISFLFQVAFAATAATIVS